MVAGFGFARASKGVPAVETTGFSLRLAADADTGTVAVDLSSVLAWISGDFKESADFSGMITSGGRHRVAPKFVSSVLALDTTRKTAAETV